MTDIILAISGNPGLYKLVSRGNRTLIVESIDEAKRRFPAGMRDRVTSLGDVSMYTEAEDVALMQVFQNLYNAEQGETKVSHNEATDEQLVEIMNVALPTWDADRIHKSDIRKLIQWYNILVRGGYTEFVTPSPNYDYNIGEGAEAPVEETPAEETPAAETPAEETPAAE